MTKATENGHCQCCGRIQAITPRGVAKHGYTTDYGFFNGTCSGSDRLPLEIDCSLNNATVSSLRGWAIEREAEADGEITMVPCTTYERDRWGKRVSIVLWLDQAQYTADKRFYGSWDHAVQSHRFSLRRKAELARAQASDLETLRDRVHGQPLIARAVEAPLHREHARCRSEAFVRCETLKAEGKRDVRQRRESGFRGGFAITYRD